MQRESFGSRLGFLLVSAGCAIGIGNVWRFPTVAGQSGGGVFGLLLGVVLCFAFFTVLPLLESVVPLTEFRELVDQSALAQVFENGNLIISIMNRRL